MKEIPIYLCLAALLVSACASNAPTPMAASPTALDTATSTPSAAPTITSTPTITLTPTPTATFTITPTPTPDIPAIIQGLVSEFGLNTAREYQIVTTETGEYLVDTFNGAPMLRREGSGWVETDWEERYGHFLPEEPRQPYIGRDNIIGDTLFDSRDNRFHARDMSPVATGNTIEVVMPDWEGRDVRAVFLESVIRYQNTEGVVEVLPIYVYMGSDDVLGNNFISVRYNINSPDGAHGPSFWYSAPTVAEVVEKIPPGFQIKFNFQYLRPNVFLPIPYEHCREYGYCIEDYLMDVELYETQAETLQNFNDRINSGEKVGDLTEHLFFNTTSNPILDYYSGQDIPQWFFDWMKQMHGDDLPQWIIDWLDETDS